MSLQFLIFWCDLKGSKVQEVYLQGNIIIKSDFVVAKITI